jgi:hypothetical protein
MHDLLLQHSDHSFQLLLWNERLHGSDTVTLQLASGPASANVYDPTVGTTPVQSCTNITQFPLTLSDHPLIIRLPARSK